MTRLKWSLNFVVSNVVNKFPYVSLSDNMTPRHTLETNIYAINVYRQSEEPADIRPHIKEGHSK